MAPGLAGAVATLASNAITTPLDVVRTQAMVQGARERAVWAAGSTKLDKFLKLSLCSRLTSGSPLGSQTKDPF